MSDLSDALKATIDALSEESKKAVDEKTESNTVFMDPDEVLGEMSGDPEVFTATRNFYNVRSVSHIHRIFRRRVGGPVFESPEHAYDTVKDPMLDSLTPMLFDCMADGIQYGQGTSQAYKKYKTLRKLDQALTNKSWRDESSWIALSYTQDPECMEIARNHLENTVRGLGGASGYLQGAQELNRIWDLWLMTSTSAIISTYLVGHRLGTTTRENDVLSGIMAATEEAHE